MTALFLGMISAFLGMVFADIRSGLAGWIPIFVLLFSAFVMGICGLLVKVCKMKWLENYALPISMLCLEKKALKSHLQKHTPMHLAFK